MKPEKCSECGAELRLRPASCPLCGADLAAKAIKVAAEAPDEDTYHSNVRQLRDELKRLRDEAQTA
jgi:predicted amidophosphoribosyltransferase